MWRYSAFEISVVIEVHTPQTALRMWGVWFNSNLVDSILYKTNNKHKYEQQTLISIPACKRGVTFDVFPILVFLHIFITWCPFCNCAKCRWQRIMITQKTPGRMIKKVTTQHARKAQVTFQSSPGATGTGWNMAKWPPERHKIQFLTHTTNCNPKSL